jgi:hypothetical protein
VTRGAHVRSALADRSLPDSRSGPAVRAAERAERSEPRSGALDSRAAEATPAAYTRAVM